MTVWHSCNLPPQTLHKVDYGSKTGKWSFFEGFKTYHFQQKKVKGRYCWAWEIDFPAQLRETPSLFVSVTIMVFLRRCSIPEQYGFCQVQHSLLINFRTILKLHFQNIHLGVHRVYGYLATGSVRRNSSEKYNDYPLVCLSRESTKVDHFGPNREPLQNVVSANSVYVYLYVYVYVCTEKTIWCAGMEVPTERVFNKAKHITRTRYNQWKGC